jgi:excisionase family DNA binding protein
MSAPSATPAPPPTKPGQAALSPRQAAVYIGVSPGKVYKLMSEGALPFVIFGRNRRIRIADLDRLLGASEEAAR